MNRIFHVSSHALGRHPNIFSNIITRTRASQTRYVPIVLNIYFFWPKEHPSQRCCALDRFARLINLMDATRDPLSIAASGSPAPMAINPITVNTVAGFRMRRAAVGEDTSLTTPLS